MKKRDRRLRSSSERCEARKEGKMRGTHGMIRRIENERVRTLAQEGKLGYRLGDGEWLKLRYDGFTACIIVYFKQPLSYAEIFSRMEKAFGDLK